MQSLQIETSNYGQGQQTQNMKFDDILLQQDFEFRTQTKFQENLKHLTNFLTLKRLGVFFSIIMLLILMKSIHTSLSSPSNIETLRKNTSDAENTLKLWGSSQTKPDGEDMIPVNDIVKDYLDSSSTFANDGSTYTQVWRALKNKISGFIILKRNSDDVNKVDAQLGPWGTTFDEFTEHIVDGQQQVAFVYSGDQLYEVVYAPSQYNLTPLQVLENYGLPSNAASLETFGIQTPKVFVITEKSQLTATNLATQAKSSEVTY